MDRENSEVEMEMQRKERLNEKESREARKTALSEADAAIKPNAAAGEEGTDGK